ncbi:rod shape-determining protein MreD [Psychrobacter aestuarii]|uniref:Rod shape-determining protein MreD n=1 Tax=Psychrobacter aestuarii TaxID=556327 RepID=A0ABN0VVA9_9GAMM|nr:rod shape-determining protein MreD [Psychrobacter aestuarii]
MHRTLDDRSMPRVPMALSVLAGFIVLLYPLPAQAVMQRPLLLMMVLIYWLLYQPRYVGVGYAFVLGLLADVFLQQPLGQHSIIWVVTAFLVMVCRRYLLPLSWWRAWLIAALGIIVAGIAQSLWLYPRYLSADGVFAPFIYSSIIAWPLVMCLLHRSHRPQMHDDW